MTEKRASVGLVWGKLFSVLIFLLLFVSRQKVMGLSRPRARRKLFIGTKQSSKRTNELNYSNRISHYRNENDGFTQDNNDFTILPLMIHPKNNKPIHWVFHHYIRLIIKNNFKAFNFNSIEIDPNKSVLLLANHFGWWDGFLLYWLNYLLLKKKFHIMILEDTVRKVFFLKYMGAFSVVKNSRSMMESLEYAGNLLHDPQNLVLIFPQARLYSNFVDEVHFERGLLKVMKQAAGKFQYVFTATFIEYFQHKKPTINVYVDASAREVTTIDELKSLYQQHYDTAKQRQTQIII